MIRYRLICDKGHEFEGWFRNSGAFDAQAGHGHVACPHCGSHKVSKAVMAPNVEAGAGRDGLEAESTSAREHAMKLLRRMRDHVVRTSDYVGDRFAEEARKIHHSETEPRAIYGEATDRQACELREEGIEFHPLPPLPEDYN